MPRAKRKNEESKETYAKKKRGAAVGTQQTSSLAREAELSSGKDNTVDIDNIAAAITAKVLSSLDDKIENAVKRQLDLAAKPNSNVDLDIPSEDNNNNTLQLDLDFSPEDNSKSDKGENMPLLNGSLVPWEKAYQEWSSVSVDEAIPGKLKSQIWANEFVEFSVLLKPKDSEKFDVSVDFSDKGPKMSLAPRTKKTIYDYDEWSSAFNIYKCIYCRKFPGAQGSLAKYGELIREIKRDGVTGSYMMNYLGNIELLSRSLSISLCQKSMQKQ